jgi:hypothetical protein
MTEKRAIPKLIFTDSGGNKLYGMAKKDGGYQWSAKNAKGQLVGLSGTLALIKRAGLAGVMGKKISAKKRGKTTFTKFEHKGETRCK